MVDAERKVLLKQPREEAGACWPSLAEGPTRRGERLSECWLLEPEEELLRPVHMRRIIPSGDSKSLVRMPWLLLPWLPSVARWS